ncbi:MAG: hypothetical protein BalsKO_02030 [Balneolaceae bacterium]
MILQAKYYLDDTFLMTNRGIVFAGHITDGELSFNDYIEFQAFGIKLMRKIIGIEGVTFSQPEKVNTGLLIKCRDDNEEKEIRKWKPNSMDTNIYRFDKPIRLWADFNASTNIGLRLNCNGSVDDLKMQGIDLVDGMPLLLWDEDVDDNNVRDDLVVMATARYNKETMIWEGEFNWGDIKNESEINE